jgi:hypothetical protein
MAIMTSSTILRRVGLLVAVHRLLVALVMALTASVHFHLVLFVVVLLLLPHMLAQVSCANLGKMSTRHWRMVREMVSKHSDDIALLHGGVFPDFWNDHILGVDSSRSMVHLGTHLVVHVVVMHFLRVRSFRLLKEGRSHWGRLAEETHVKHALTFNLSSLKEHIVRSWSNSLDMTLWGWRSTMLMLMSLVILAIAHLGNQKMHTTIHVVGLVQLVRNHAGA